MKQQRTMDLIVLFGEYCCSLGVLEVNKNNLPHDYYESMHNAITRTANQSLVEIEKELK